MNTLFFTAVLGAATLIGAGLPAQAMQDTMHGHGHHAPSSEASPLTTHDDHHGLHAEEAGLFVLKPYAFATAKMQKNGAVFFDIHNHLEEDDRLIAVSADVSEKVEMHTHSHDNGVMQMREVEGYDIPAGTALTFAPMGHHIMLIGLTSRLEQGQSFPLTLTFENAGEKTVDVMIVKPGEVPHNH